MFDGLARYRQWSHFVFQSGDRLRQVCNAPTDKSGIYIVYALKNGGIELVYIGSSGEVQGEGTLFIRRAGLGGIKDRIVNGHQFGKIPRRNSWPIKMKKEGIEALDVYWYVTHDYSFVDCPRIVENRFLQQYTEIYGQLPRWNAQL
ncbi:MAG: hypothetical protein AB7F88_14140 [Pyrinomonadaceae bacterium]